MIARRKLVGAFVVAGGAVALLPAASAQQLNRMPRIFVLDWEAPSPTRERPFLEALGVLGYVENRNIVVDYSYAQGRADRARALAADFVGRSVDVIVAFTTPAAHIVKEATTTIPVVVVSSDPLGTGLVANLSRPGGNITGVSNMMPDLEAKRMELLREMLPGVKRVAFLGSKTDPATVNFVREAQAAAGKVGIDVVPSLIVDQDQIDEAFAKIVDNGLGAVLVQPLFTLDHAPAAIVAAQAIRYRLPTVTSFWHLPRAGGLISYGPDPEFGRRRAAHYVDRILKGARPGELAVEQPTNFVLVINLRAAKALDITIPASILARADEVIE